jgi:hypothetical protein
VTNDQVCYFGSDPGLSVSAPAGSIVAFSSVLIHRSGANSTDRMRRVYLAQYSRDVIHAKGSTEPQGSFEKFLDGGRIVADR